MPETTNKYTTCSDREIITTIVGCGRNRQAYPFLKYLFCIRYGPMIVRKSESSTLRGAAPEEMPAEMMAYFCRRFERDPRCYPRLQAFLESKWESFEGYLATATLQRLLEM